MYYSRRSNPILYMLAFCTVIFLIVPVVVIILISFSSSRYLEFPPQNYSLRWYQNLFSDTSWLDSILLSLEVAILVTIIASALGTLAALGLIRSNNLLKKFMHSFFLAPLIIPVIVTGVASYFYYSTFGLIETRISLIFSHTVLALPIVIISVSTSLHNLDHSLELVARTLGATPFNAFRRITLPLIRPGILSGGLFAFIISFDEPVIALFIAGTKAVTLPKRMWDGIQYEIDPTVASVSTIIILFTSLIFFLSEFIRNRGHFEIQ